MIDREKPKFVKKFMTNWIISSQGLFALLLSLVLLVVVSLDSEDDEVVVVVVVVVGVGVDNNDMRWAESSPHV